MNQDIDNILDSIRAEEPTAEQTEQAAARVRQKLFGAGSADIQRITGCADYRSLFPAYIDKSLSDARRMLVDDHIRECGGCRRAFDEARGVRPKVVPFAAASSSAAPRKSNAPMFQKWAIAAGLFAAVGSSSWGIMKWLFPAASSGSQVASIQTIQGGMLYQGNLPVTEGREIGAGDSIRTPAGTRAVVKLQDGSLVEVNERSEMSVSRGWNGTTIRLDRGNIIVQAAKQRSGSLMVSTSDALVSVKGTIFAVNRGVKGSRVSVVEGSVQVEQKARGSAEMLKPGDQATTDSSLAKNSVADEVSWSKDSARYLAMLSELNALGKKLDQIPGPGLRYSSKLLPLMPQGTVVYAAIPNLGNTIAESKRVFDEHLKESPALRGWWEQSSNASNRAKVDEIIRDIQQFASFIGDEVVVTLSASGKRPAAFAEIRKEGLEAFINEEARKLGANNAPVQGKDYLIHKNILILSDSVASLNEMKALVDRGGLPTGAFGERIAQAYQSGAGWLLCADMEAVLRDTKAGAKARKGNFDFGVDNAKYLVIERKEIAGKTQNIAALSFTEERHGVMSWLAAPSSMSTLDFVSPDAGMAAAAVVKNPRLVVEELFAAAKGGQFDINLQELEAKTGLKIIDDLAAPIGSEFAIASDGPVLQSLSWKLAAEMYSPQRFQNSVEKLVEAFNRETRNKLTLSTSELDKRTFYALKIDGVPFEIHYTYVDGYLLAGANRALLATAILNRQNGHVLIRTEKFRSQLPYGANPNFSAVVYHNMGSALNPVAEQLKNSGYGTDEFRKGLDGVKDMQPGVIAIYGEPTRITAATHGDFFGVPFGNLSLASFDKGGLGLMQLLGNTKKEK
jgi:hypothetical protein